jgi:hypothetical protein
MKILVWIQVVAGAGMFLAPFVLYFYSNPHLILGSAIFPCGIGLLVILMGLNNISKIKR